MKSQSPFTCKKTFQKHQRTKAGSGAVRHWLQEGGGCLAASAQHVHAARRAVSALRQTRLLPAKCFQILTSSEAASALAVAVFSQALAALGKVLPAVKAALACFDAVPTSHFEAALHT